MKITIDTTDLLDGLQMEVITTKNEDGPVTAKIFVAVEIVRIFLSSIVLALSLIPAVIYVIVVAEFWPALKGEGLTVWEAGTGIVALYGLGLHWWRTTILNKQYQVDLKKTYRSELRARQTFPPNKSELRAH